MTGSTGSCQNYYDALIVQGKAVFDVELGGALALLSGVCPLTDSLGIQCLAKGSILDALLFACL